MKLKGKTDIQIFSGTTFYGKITLTNEDDELFLLSENDKIIFGVKQNSECTEYDIKKVLTFNNEINGSYPFVLSAEETALYPCKYFYDVGVQLEDGDFYIVVPCSEFNVKRTVTQKESE